MTNLSEKEDIGFYNQVMNRASMRLMINRLVAYLGNNATAKILDELKILGFKYATETGVSLGIDDLLTTPSKAWLIQDAEYQADRSEDECLNGGIHHVEKLRQIVETWHITSEHLKQEMSINFVITDPLNPVHMMSFSGARGNSTQVHQLVGMRGLMSDPQGQIIDLPIQSNLREGLSLTEYIISCYGARKGVVDTAVRTADAGYLTRRLVEVVQHIVIRNFDCGTVQGITFDAIKKHSSGIIILPLGDRLIGRVIAENIYFRGRCIALRNQDIGSDLVYNFSIYRQKNILIRSPLTCSSIPRACRLCYGWDLSYGNLVELGQAIGIVAGQSIGEPGTQLTLRTFHTGGVFSGDVAEHVRAPFNGIVNFDCDFLQPTRNRHGRPAWICSDHVPVTLIGQFQTVTLDVPPQSFLLLRQQQYVESRQIVAEVRATAAPLKEEVSKGTYSDLEGQIHSGHLMQVTISPLLYRSMSLSSQRAGHLWVSSYHMMTYSLLNKYYIIYNDQDYITHNIPLGVFFKKKKRRKRKKIKKILFSQTDGSLYTSRFHLSNINDEVNYQSIFILSSTDQFRSLLSLSKDDVNNKDILIENNLHPEEHIHTYRSYCKIKSLNLRKIDKTINNNICNLNFKCFKLYYSNSSDFLFNEETNEGLWGSQLRPKSFYKPTYKIIHPLKSITKDNINLYKILKSTNSTLEIKLQHTEFNILDEFDLINHSFFYERTLSKFQSLYYIFLIEKKNILFKLGQFISKKFESLSPKMMTSESGRLLSININDIIIQLAKPYLVPSQAYLYVHHQEPIQQGKTLFTLIYERLKTSDITQGLPKAEQLLEARFNNEVSLNLQENFEYWTQKIKKYMLLPYSILTPKLIQCSQIELVNRIQAVYLAQGVYTSDKHLELIIRQMTSKVLILEHGDPTAISPQGVVRWLFMSKIYDMCLYLPGELVEFQQVQRVHLAIQQPMAYKPILVGVTKAALSTNSFLSEASFERTAHVLSKSAFEGRIDWMKGLKENIICGNIIPAGTGCVEPYSYSVLDTLPNILRKKNKNKSFKTIIKYKVCYNFKLLYLKKKKQSLRNNLRRIVHPKYNEQKQKPIILENNLIENDFLVEAKNNFNMPV